MALGGNIVKRVELKITADDGDTQAKLDAIHAKAEELAREHPEIKVRIDAAEASAKMAVLRKELRDTAKSADDTRDHVGIFSSLLHGNFSQAISGVTSLISGAGGGGGLLGALGSLADPVLIGATIAAGGLALVLLGPVIAGLFAVAASVGSLALFAIPAFTKIWGAVTGGKKAMDALHGPMRAVAEEGKGLVGMFDQIAKAVQPSLMQMFASGLRVIKDLMPSLKPLAEGAARAFTGLFNEIGKWVNGPSGQKFLHWLDSEGPAAMRRFAQAIFDMGAAVGRVFSFLDHQGETWDSNFKKNVSDAKAGWSSMSEASKQGAATQSSAWSLIIQAGFKGSAAMRTAWNLIVDAGARGAQAVLGETESIVRFFASMAGQVLSELGSLPGQLEHIGEAAMQGLLSGLESAAGGILGWAEHMASDISGAFSKILHILSPSRVFFQHGVNIGRGLILGMDSTRGQILAAAGRMAAAVTGPRPGSLSLGAAGAAAGGQLVIEVHPGAGGGLDHLFMTWLANAIRAKGGDPRILVRKVEFA